MFVVLLWSAKYGSFPFAAKGKKKVIVAFYLTILTFSLALLRLHLKIMAFFP